MQPLIETVEDVQFLSEGTGTQKKRYVEGIFLQAEIRNRNGRRYPLPILEREVKRYNKECIKENRAYGELGHPNSHSINPERISHRIVELRQDVSNFYGKARILDTPYGNIVYSLLEDGGKLGVSSRGIGSLQQVSEGHDVQDDYYMATPADIVIDPSAPDAFVSGIMENREWVYENGIVKSSEIEAYKEKVRKARKKQLEEACLGVFQDFLNKVKINRTS